MSDPMNLQALLREEACRDVPDNVPQDVIYWLRRAADEIDSRDAEIERLRCVVDDLSASKAAYETLAANRWNELAEARADKDAWMHEFHATIAEQQTQLAEARGMLDQIETLAVNDKTGCKTCTAIVNLICTADQPSAAEGER